MLRQESLWCEQCQRNTRHEIGVLNTGLNWLMILSTCGAWLVVFLVHHLCVLPFLHWHCQTCGMDQK